MAADRVMSLPKWTPAGVHIPEGNAFDAGPFGRSEVALHVVGGVLNVAVTTRGVSFLAANFESSWPAWPWYVVGVGAGMYTADLASGVLHWTFDTWFDENVRLAHRMILIVREHHVYPQLIFKYPVSQEVGLMSWFGLLGSAPVVLLVTRRAMRPSVGVAAILGVLTFDVLVTLSLELHKFGHTFTPGPTLRTLQKLGLVLSAKQHMRHHAGEHDSHYCIVNGWADATLGRLGFFRMLEALAGSITGSAPRANDRVWRRRYGRWVSPTHPVRCTEQKSEQ